MWTEISTNQCLPSVPAPVAGVSTPRFIRLDRYFLGGLLVALNRACVSNAKPVVRPMLARESQRAVGLSVRDEEGPPSSSVCSVAS